MALRIAIVIQIGLCLWVYEGEGGSGVYQPASVSLEKRFSKRPVGCDEKNESGSLTILLNLQACIDFNTRYRTAKALHPRILFQTGHEHELQQLIQ